MSASPRLRRQEPLSEEELFEYAVGSLARRMRSVRDLRRLMANRVEPGAAGDEIMDRVLRRLEELRYLSDERFARDFVRLRRENQAHGRRRVQQDLAGKGISKELVTRAVGEAFDNADELAEARRYADRKRLTAPAGPKATARIVGRLLRAGFSSTTTWRLLREWKVEIEEADLADTGQTSD